MTELQSVERLSPAERELAERALAVRKRAYAPYSRFHVGCALRDEGGRIHEGCNVENASYGAVVCAERSAIVRMVAEGGREVRLLAVATSSEEAFFPCGICLQVIREFGRETQVIALNGEGTHFRRASLEELYPSAFSPDRWTGGQS